MLHLITGWETPGREGEPTVLYCGTDRSKAQKVATEADPKFIRVEYAEVLMGFKWSRRIAPQNSTHKPIAAAPAPAGAAALSAEVVGTPPVAPSPEGATVPPDESGPQLAPASASDPADKKSNRR